MDQINQQLTLRQKTFLVICSFVFMGMIEGLSRLAYTKDELDEIKEVIRIDDTYMWKNRENLSMIFKGQSLHTDSSGNRIILNQRAWNDSSRRILIMGPSPCFGFGVDDKSTYSNLLQEYFNKKFQDVSVRNASQVGFSSYQGKKLFKNILSQEKVKPTEVIISYVVNDLDHYRFFYNSRETDRNVKISMGWKNKIQSLLEKSKFYKLIERGLYRIPFKQKTNVAENFRVPIDDYKQNIYEMIEDAKLYNIKVWLLKYPLVLPENTETRMMNGNIDIYNQSLERISIEKGVGLIDVVSVLKKSREYPFIDKEKDTFHPNKIGHEIIKNKIIEVIK